MQQHLRRLTETLTALREGIVTHCSITRLTSLKCLCRLPEVVTEFVLSLARCTEERMRTMSRPRSTTPADWEHERRLVADAVMVMQQYRHDLSPQTLARLDAVRSKAAAVQTSTGAYVWGHPIREIRSREVLVIEDALQCFRTPQAASYWAYHTAL